MKKAIRVERIGNGSYVINSKADIQNLDDLEFDLMEKVEKLSNWEPFTECVKLNQNGIDQFFFIAPMSMQQKGGLTKTESRAKASAENGKKGGRPKKNKDVKMNTTSKPLKQWDLSLLNKCSEPTKSEVKQLFVALQEQIEIGEKPYLTFAAEGRSLEPTTETYRTFQKICEVNGINRLIPALMSENGKPEYFDVSLDDIH